MLKGKLICDRKNPVYVLICQIESAHLHKLLAVPRNETVVDVIAPVQRALFIRISLGENALQSLKHVLRRKTVEMF